MNIIKPYSSMREGHGAMPIQFVIVNWRHEYAKGTNHGWEKKVVGTIL
jgi:hypothetical protein